ncbi:1930_t:CDS:2 [Dentiscutata erythropus]|uniref:1930_t:CDS:1 n=1 Tax=Dentiscutata erythropus TaxID=1348616 RepID=A0A9N9GNN8_9GLOM|nr:1930_t:CDS:2 [Dentiscutata erythropus]
MSDSSTSGPPRRSTRIQLASQSNIQTQLKNQRNNPIKKVDKTVASFISKEITNIKSKGKRIDFEDLTIDIDENNGNEWTEVTNKKKKAKNIDNTAIDPEVIEEDKESVLSYETDNSFHPDWRQDFNEKNLKFELTLKKFLENR